MVNLMKFKIGNLQAGSGGGEGGGSGVPSAEIQDMIAAAIEAQRAGFDDTKVIAGVSSFPSPGTEDVLYIDSDTGNQYIWDGTKYTLMTERIDEDEIRQIVNSN